MGQLPGSEALCPKVRYIPFLETDTVETHSKARAIMKEFPQLSSLDFQYMIDYRRYIPFKLPGYFLFGIEFSF